MTTTPRGIVTPEAVVLEFDTAGIASRSLARAIDAGIQGLILLVVILLAVVGFGGEGFLAYAVAITGTAFVVLGYPMLAEVLMRGRSPGKATLGLRVVTTEGAPIAPRHAFIRSALGLVDFLLVPGGLIAVVCALFSPRSQRLGDVFAGTIVLRERTATAPPQAIWFNPPVGLEGYAATLDVSAVNDAQFGLIRAFLLRVEALSPEARGSLSVRLATPLTVAMAHHTPPGVYADQFLQCVAATYQRRHVGPAPTAAAWTAQVPPPMAPLRPPPPPSAAWGQPVPPPAPQTAPAAAPPGPPPAPETAPASSNGSPLASQTTPGASNDPPAAPEVAPTASNGPPTAPEGAPTASNDPPTDPEVAPTASNGPPAAPEAAPPAPNGPPPPPPVPAPVASPGGSRSDPSDDGFAAPS
ncbi:MAG: RDD family protein [Acidimicrobiales bacterium]